MFHKAFNFRKRSGNGSRDSEFERVESQASASPSFESSSPGQDEFETSGARRSSRPHDPSTGSLGLHVICNPKDGHVADIVFIHGLGGASRRTWSKDANPDLFWPLKFLPNEPDLCLARILTFGYNSDLRAAGKVNSSILDFAKDLLFDLRYGEDEAREHLNMGSVPLIFVVHSMGGLIIKEAYMQGQNDPNFESIIKAISAIIFLATPHRGTNLAEILDRILRSTFVNSSKQYVTELAKNSFMLQKLNEQFRHVAPKLNIVSFYETQMTSIALKSARIMILERDSSVLGYPGETSKALDADHHGVCKYESPADPNYVAVRNVLRSILANNIHLAEGYTTQRSRSRRNTDDLRSLFVITEMPDVDYIYFRDQWTPGTNEWLLQEEVYSQWLNAEGSECSILWLYGGAATGKSVLASSIINSLAKTSLCCQYFFIRFDNQKKRTLNFILRSIAYQIAQSLPAFQKRLVRLIDEALDLETADPRTIWERVFKTILFDMQHIPPLYWVIDGVDEADDPHALIRLFSDVSSSTVAIRILLISRPTFEIAALFSKIPRQLHARSMTTEERSLDFRCHIHEELSMFGPDEYQRTIVGKILQNAQNNFLWVRLIVDKLNSCHTREEADTILEELPIGMEAMYGRMAGSIRRNASETHKALATKVLQYVICSLRELTVLEMSQVLVQEDSMAMLDFQRSIISVCGGFITIDNGGNVAMIHQTAREYLLRAEPNPFHIDESSAEKEIFLKCMQCLTTAGLRSRIRANQLPAFLDYAADHWSSHLVRCPLGCEETFVALEYFLKSSWVLTWIHLLSTRQQMRILVRTSKNLSRYVIKQEQHMETATENLPRIAGLNLFKSWAEDLTKLMGNFGAILRRNPESIYQNIAPFCPSKSAIHQQFGGLKDRSLTVSDYPNGKWDDSVARMAIGFDHHSFMIQAAGAHIAILLSSGNVVMYEAYTFEECQCSPICHGEKVYRMELNSSGTLLVTCGFRTTKIWQIPNGACMITVKNIESRPRPLAVTFLDNDSKLLIATDDRTIRSLDLRQDDLGWQVLAELEEAELEGSFLNAANYMTISKKGHLIAVAYRGHPLSAWEVDGPVHIGHCWRKRREIARGEVIDAVWHPHRSEVFGLYIEGAMFKWSPYLDEVSELPTGASKLAISTDGNVIATGDIRGTAKIFTTNDFRLIYQLVSQDGILSLAFSPDIRRFYDIRGHYGNAWEPNALVEFSEQRGVIHETSGDSESFDRTSPVYTDWSGRVDSLTAIAPSPVGRFVCYGTETGTVMLYDTQKTNSPTVHSSRGYFSIEQMAWNRDGHLFCFSDSSKRISVLSLNFGDDGLDSLVQTKASVPMKPALEGPILQLLFKPDSSQVLVRSSSQICIVCLESSNIIRSSETQMLGYTCIGHPKDPSLIIEVGASKLRIRSWTLEEIETYHVKITSHQSEPAKWGDVLLDRFNVERALVSQDKECLFVQMVSSERNSKKRAFFHLKTSEVSNSRIETSEITGRHQTRSIYPTFIPLPLAARMVVGLAFTSDYRLVYLSSDLDICFFKISLDASSSSSRTHKTTSAPVSHLHHGKRSGAIADAVGDSERIFSLPGDWAVGETIALAAMWTKERSFVCPKNGQLAIARSAALV